PGPQTRRSSRWSRSWPRPWVCAGSRPPCQLRCQWNDDAHAACEQHYTGKISPEDASRNPRGRQTRHKFDIDEMLDPAKNQESRKEKPSQRSQLLHLSARTRYRWSLRFQVSYLTLLFRRTNRSGPP